MYVLGLDIGYSNLKIAYGDASSTDPTTVLFPAGAAPVENMPHRLSGDEQDYRVVSVNGEKWAVGVEQGRIQSRERELHSDYPKTPGYKALFYSALVSSGKEEIDLVVTGLPVSQHLDPGRRNDLAQQLVGRHQVAAKHAVDVKAVKVLPQPAGAYMDLLSSFDEEKLNLVENGRIVVIDPGYFSFDWVLIEQGELLTASSGTSTQAMSMILAEVNNLLREDYSESVGADRIERAIRGGQDSILVVGKSTTLKPYLQRAAERVAPQAIAALRKSMRTDSAAVDLVLMTGGGASAYADAAREVFPRCEIVVPKEPVLANARGFFRFGAQEFAA